MAAASYTTDLVDIITDPAATTGWTLISTGGGGANSFTVPEVDDYIQSATPGTVGCISRSPWTSVSIRGMVYNSARTIPAGSAIFIWTKSDVAQALDTRSNGGIQALVGNATTALKCYYVDGSDTYALGGWKCYPIDPTITQSASIGSPTAATDYFGMRWNVPVSGPSKGFPYKIDALRYGSTLTLTAGDLANGYATFTDVATFQGALARQWGLFQFQNGTYLQQGKFQMGTSGTAVDFRDSNRAIFIADTLFVTSGFNVFEVNNAASRVDWTNISISSLGTVSKGNFSVVDNADLNIIGCTFTDMNTFVFQSISNISDGTTFRRCGEITANSATFTNVLITRSTAAVALQCAGTVSALSNVDFVSAGTGHAMRITSGTAHTLSNITFTGYAGSNGSTGNEAIFVDIPSGSVTITVSGGNSPTYRTAGATVSVVSGATVTFTGFPTGTDVVVLTAGTTTVLDQVDQVAGTSYAWGYQGTPTVDVGFIKPGYIPFYIRGLTLGSTNSTLPVKLTLDRNYS